MTCAWCGTRLGYVHGHAACLDGSCAMFGLNQAECCSGETAATCPAPSLTTAGNTAPHPTGAWRDPAAYNNP